MGVKKIGLGGGGGTFDGTMDDIPNGTTYVKTENNLTDAEKTILSNTSGTNSGDNAVNSLYSGLAASKQDALVSGTNIKTINSTTLLGSGDIAVQPTLVSGTTIKTINSTTLLGSGDIAVQSTLVSATNIKTINGSSILGSGDLTIGGGSPTILSLASDAATAANTTPVNLTSMSFSYDANSKYIFDMHMFTLAAAATTGHGFQLDVSSAVTQIGMSFFNQLATTGTISGGSSVADDTSLGVSSGVPNTTINYSNGKGILITGANSGTAQFRYRSETTAITTCKAGSTIIVTKIA
jgi:hypothetical protein